MGSSRMFLTTL